MWVISSTGVPATITGVFWRFPGAMLSQIVASSGPGAQMSKGEIPCLKKQ
jgi:hypothetical protein